MVHQYKTGTDVPQKMNSECFFTACLLAGNPRKWKEPKVVCGLLARRFYPHHQGDAEAKVKQTSVLQQRAARQEDTFTSVTCVRPRSKLLRVQTFTSMEHRPCSGEVELCICPVSLDRDSQDWPKLKKSSALVHFSKMSKCDVLRKDTCPRLAKTSKDHHRLSSAPTRTD